MKKMIKIKIFVFIAALFLANVLFAGSASAGYWGESFMSTAMKQMWEQIQEQIKGVMLGAGKQMAVKAIESQVSNLMSGGKKGSGGAMFITDPNQFLNIDPAKEAQKYMNDFFTMTTRGTASAMNYTATNASNQASGMMNNYSTYLVQQAKNSIMGSLPQTNMQEYASDPSQMFAQGNWRAFSAFISNPANNPFGYTLMAQQAYMNKAQQESNKKMAEFIAFQGFKGVEKDGQIVTPGSTVKDIQSQVQDIGNKILADAQNMPEIITAVVTRMITKTLTQGIGEAMQNAEKENSSQDAGYW